MNRSFILKTGLEVVDHNRNTRQILHTPLHIVAMYNISGNSGSCDQSICISPAGSFYISYSEHQDYLSKTHSHDFFEFLIVLKGKLYQEIEGQNYMYTAGSCCLLNRNILHAEKFLGEGTILFIGMASDYLKELIRGGNSGFFREMPQISNRIFSFMEENMTARQGKNYLDIFPVYQHDNAYGDSGDLYVHGEKNTTLLYRICNDLISHLFLPGLGSEYIIRGLLYELFNYLDSPKAFHVQKVSLNTKNDDLIFSRVQSLMEDSCGRLKRSELEQALNYSGNYLNTIVKQHTGLSLFDYGTQFAMQEAARLLTDTGMSVAAIMEKLQFTNQGHFNRLFKAQYGMLPGKYRAAYKIRS